MIDGLDRGVPCNGCVACCHNELIILHPEDGDRPENYVTMPVINPHTGQPALALLQKPDGACLYLGPDGCTIHGRAPAICRAFDCRRFLVELRKRTDRKMVERMIAGTPMLQAAVERLPTLKGEK